MPRKGATAHCNSVGAIKFQPLKSEHENKSWKVFSSQLSFGTQAREIPGLVMFVGPTDTRITRKLLFFCCTILSPEMISVGIEALLPDFSITSYSVGSETEI